VPGIVAHIGAARTVHMRKHRMAHCDGIGVAKRASRRSINGVYLQSAVPMRYSKTLRRRLCAVLRLSAVLSGFFSTAAISSDLSDLQVSTVTTETSVKDSVRVIIIRRGAAISAPFTLFVDKPLIMSLASGTGECGQGTGGANELALAAGTTNPTLVCVRSAERGRARVVATAIEAGNLVVAQSELMKFDEKSIGSSPVLMTMISAVIGFLFGLGSTWFSAFTEAWRNRQKTRTETQQFIAETFFPEIRANSSFIAKYLHSSSADRQRLATKSLAAPAVTEVFSAARFNAICDYFGALKRPALRESLEAYDGLSRQFNDAGNVLQGVNPDQRDTAKQEAVAVKLSETLGKMGFQ
jgi:hypothetical protein